MACQQRCLGVLMGWAYAAMWEHVVGAFTSTGLHVELSSADKLSCTVKGLLFENVAYLHSLNVFGDVGPF